MFAPFSATQTAFKRTFVRPLPMLGGIVAFYLLLLVIWSLMATVSVRAIGVGVQLTDDGVILVVFPPGTDVRIGQTAYVEPLGQQEDSALATVEEIDMNGQAYLQLTHEQDKERLLDGSVQIERVILIVDQMSPAKLLISNR